MKLSLVVPCYNEQDNVFDFYDCVENCFSTKDFDYEIVFVNDGSRDDTFNKLKEIVKTKKGNIQVVSFSRNFGKESAIYAGLTRSKGDRVCIIDADLQQRPEVVVQMMEILDEKPELDCVAAYQQKRKEGGLISAVKSCFYKVINKMSEVDFVNGASDFRLMKRPMVDAVLSLSERHRFSKGIFSCVGFNTKYIPYDVAERQSGETKWSVYKLFKYAFDGIISFSTFPLKLATGVGLVTSAISVLYLFIVIIQKLFFGIDVPGYATIVVLVLFLGGMQLFCLGILGEYISKLFIQSKNRPIYILKEHLGKNEHED